MGFLGIFKKIQRKKSRGCAGGGKVNESESPYDVVKELGILGYQMKHFDMCKHLWKTKVPKSGQADTVQGELLRQAEKLRNEARDNGNMNWDGNYTWFCNFIIQTFESAEGFNKDYLDKLVSALTVVKECGEYAAEYNAGKIPEDDVDPNRIAYTEEDLYNFIEDGIAEFVIKNPIDIPNQKKDFIYR